MFTPEEVNDRLLVGYVPTYILVMVHVAVLETDELWLRVVLSVLAGVGLFVADSVTSFKYRDRWSKLLQSSRDGGTGNVLAYWAIVYPGVILAFLSNSYDGSIATVSVTMAGMFTTRELLEKFRLRKLRQTQSGIEDQINAGG